MKTVINTLILLLCTNFVLADETVIQISALEGILIVSNGPVTARKVRIQNLSDTPIITPNPTDPPVATDRVKKLKEVVETIEDQKTASNLAGLFTAIASQIDSGVIKNEDQLEEMYTRSLDFFLTGSRETKWEPFKEEMESLWIRLAKEGGTLEDYSELLSEASGVLTNPSELAKIDMESIFEILEIIQKGELKPRDFVRIAFLVLQLFT